jgi:hypothetical protein
MEASETVRLMSAMADIPQVQNASQATELAKKNKPQGLKLAALFCLFAAFPVNK